MTTSSITTKKKKPGKKRIPGSTSIGNKFRIYPTDDQIKIINTTIAGCRLVWNWYLEQKYMNISLYNANKITTIDELKKFVQKEIKNLCNRNLWKKIKELPIDKQLIELKDCLRVKFITLIYSIKDINSIDSVIIEFREAYNISENIKSKNLTQLKKDNVWLNECLSQALVHAMKNANDTFSKAFKGQCGYPKFKSYKQYNSFSQQQNSPKPKKDGTFTYANKLSKTSDKFGLLTISKLPGIKIRLHRDVDSILGRIEAVTISRTPAGNYYASFPTDVMLNITEKDVTENTSVGIDVGIQSLICCSNGSKFKTVDVDKLEQRKKVLQRRLEKKRSRNSNWKKSKTYQKERQKLAKIEEKIANCRRDNQHKLSHKLVDENSFIGMEDLKVSEMLKNKRLAKRISHAGWHTLSTQIIYKGKQRGTTVQKVDRYFPSTKTCSNCGQINNTLELKDRVWICDNCNTEHDRDINAAINIKNEALTQWNKKQSKKNKCKSNSGSSV